VSGTARRHILAYISHHRQAGVWLARSSVTMKSQVIHRWRASWGSEGRGKYKLTCERRSLNKKQVPFDSPRSLRAGSPLRSLHSPPVGMTKFSV
jgi:hypothetical protein